jgi:ParB-like chromosome segregation protein Spo0J
MTSETMKAHWVADIFPLNDADVDRLAEDIKANGQVRPIIVHKGLVIDGRTRLAACEKAGVEPIVEEYQPQNGEPTDEELLALSWSLNEVRRHLTTSQRACAAAEVIERLPEEARGRGGKRRGINPKNGVGTVLQRFTVGEETVRQARELLRDDPAQFAKVKAGLKTVSDAFKEHAEIDEAIGQMRAKAEDNRRLDLLAQRHADLAEKVQFGSMTFDDAEKEAQARDDEAKARMDALHKLLCGVTVAMGTIKTAGRDMQVQDWTDILRERHGWQRENYLRDIEGTLAVLEGLREHIKELETGKEA